MTVLLDECVPLAWVAALSDHGHHPLRWLTVGEAGASDDEVLRWARAHDALVLTCDDDLGQRLWFTHAQGPSVVQLGAPTWLPRTCLGPVLQALDECAARPQTHYFVRISAAQGAFKLHALPLG